MGTFSERFRELIDSYKFKSDNEFALLINDSNENVSRIASGKVSAPKITFLQKVTTKCNLNPYKLYKLLTGEVYTEKPKGSVTAELEALKKENAELKETSKRYLKIIENFSEAHSNFQFNECQDFFESNTDTSHHQNKNVITHPKDEENNCGVPVGAEKKPPFDQALH